MSQLGLVINPRGSLGEAFAWLFRTSAHWAPATRDKRQAESVWLMRVLGEDTPIASIDYEVLCRYMATSKAAGLAMTTVKARLDCLRLALKEAIRRGLLPALPHWPRLIDTRPAHAKRAPSVAEYEAVRPHIPAHQVDWYDAAYWTGMRKGDITGTRRYHVDMREGTWLRRSTKTKARPEIFPMPPRWRTLLEVSLERHPRADTDRLFGEWNNASRDVGRACDEACVPRFTCNDLRRGCEARLVLEGHALPVVRLWICHSDTVARRYYETLSDDLREQLRTRLLANGDHTRNESETP